LQTWFAPHTTPHLPQFFGSVDVFVHVDPHMLLGALHADTSLGASVDVVTSGVTLPSLPPGGPPDVLPPLAHPPAEKATPRASASKHANSERGWVMSPSNEG
jgi:hypothetical protein